MSPLDPSHYLRGLPLDYLEFEKVRPYFAKDYRTISVKKGGIADEVIARVEVYNKKIQAGSKAFENIEKLKENPAIVTGQQPCLLTGPLFVMYKALTAIVLAERYDAVPVFWNASEDDDIPEVDHTWILGNDLTEIHLSLEQKPFSKIVLREADIQSLLSQLSVLPETEYREDISSLVKNAPQSFSEMFSYLLSTLFSEYGLIVVEPHLFSDLAIPVYRGLIEHPLEATALVNRAGDSLESQGYKRQVHKSGESCSFYVTFNERRYSVAHDGQFHVGEHTFNKRELLSLLEEHPETFSSTVISRPLVQDYLFSTLAYCAGPGEITYFAQMKEVYRFFHVEEPYIIPRFGATVVEKNVRRIMEKYHLTIADLFEPEKVTKTLARMDLDASLAGSKTQVMTGLQDIEAYVASIDPNLQKAAAAVRARIVKELEALEGKTTASLKQKNRITEEQIAKASLHVFPHRMLQERVLNVFGYLVKYPSLISTLYRHCASARPGEHLLIEVME